MKKLFLAMLLISGVAQAECNEACPPKPKVVYKTVTVKEQSKEPINATADAGASSTGQAQATTGQQSIVINMPQPTKERVKLIKRTVYKTHKVRFNVTNPNRLQLLLGQSKTKLDVEQDCCNFKATRKYEPDLGLQYLRDFGGFTGSLMGTTNKSYYLGVGFNW